MAMSTALSVCEQAEKNLQSGTPATPYDAGGTANFGEDSERGSDEERVIAAHFSAGALRDFAAVRDKVDRSGWDVFADTPAQYLLAELNRRPWIKEIRVESGSLVLELGTEIGVETE